MGTARIKINVTLPAGSTRTLLLLLLVAGCLCIPPHAVMATKDEMAPNATSSHGQRRFYITSQFYSIPAVWLACEEGYHFASLWELLDVSNLRYNSTLGITSSDSGAGPPTATSYLFGSMAAKGWVRTGYPNHTGNTPGRANCNGYLFPSANYYDTTARLPTDWINGQKDIGVWDAGTSTCDYDNNRVWCIEDSVMSYVFLPIVMKG